MQVQTSALARFSSSLACDSACLARSNSANNRSPNRKHVDVDVNKQQCVHSSKFKNLKQYLNVPRHAQVTTTTTTKPTFQFSLDGILLHGLGK